MTDRYSRQELFKEIGKDGQKKFRNASVTIVGVGALGSVSADLLTRAGIGRIVIIDNDKVEWSNLQRQSLYDENDVLKYKVDALKKHLGRINSDVKIETLAERVTSENINKIISDVIIDGSDNMETRFLLNEYSKKTKTPFIYGAASGSIGVVFNVLNYGACLSCIFSDSKNLATCESDGILSSTTHIVASLQVTEVLKVILGKNPSKELMRFDVWKNKFENFKVNKSNKCNVCKSEYMLLDKKDYEEFVVSECKTKSAFTAKPKKKMSLDIRRITKNFETIEDAMIIAIIKVDGEEIIVHDYGELLFKTITDVDRIKKIAKEIYRVGKR